MNLQEEIERVEKKMHVTSAALRSLISKGDFGDEVHGHIEEMIADLDEEDWHKFLVTLMTARAECLVHEQLTRMTA